MTLLIYTAIALTGCAATTPDVIVGEDPAIRQLRAVADEVHQSVQRLAELQQVVTPRPSTYAVPQSGPLAQPVTLSWDGPPEPVIDMLADMIGYDYRTLGTPPLTPHVVTLDVRNQPAWTVLEDIGWQLGNNVTVVVNEKIGELQLVYEGQQP